MVLEGFSNLHDSRVCDSSYIIKPVLQTSKSAWGLFHLPALHPVAALLYVSRTAKLGETCGALEILRKTFDCPGLPDVLSSCTVYTGCCQRKEVFQKHGVECMFMFPFSSSLPLPLQRERYTSAFYFVSLVF